MHDIWNPWHGCKKISEGCLNCYMYFLDKKRDMDGSKIFKCKNAFNYPLQRKRNGEYKIKSGEQIRLCMTSDFFLEEADSYRAEVWKIIKKRSDVKFYILTKRADRIEKCLPSDWNEGYENVSINVTCENQRRADERVPILLEIKAKHKGIMVAPFIGKVNIDKYLSSGDIEQVICGGENYDGNRACDFDWVKFLHCQCLKYNVSFSFIETGTTFIKDSKVYNIKGKILQAQMAHKAGLNYKGKEIVYNLYDENGNRISEENLFKPYFRESCEKCGSKMICNGCSKCGKCK